MMVYAVAGYIVGLLVYPFFWSFVAGRPAYDSDGLSWIFASVFWPLILIIAFVYGCWYVMSVIGSWGRSLLDRAWDNLKRWARES